LIVRRQKAEERAMGEPGTSGRPKWVLIGTAVLGLAAALLVVVARVYEVRKARAEAARAEASAGADAGTLPRGAGEPSTPVPEPPVVGSWETIFRNGTKATFTIRSDHTITGDNGYEGRWEQTGRRVTVVGSIPTIKPTWKAEGEIDPTGKTMTLVDIDGGRSNTYTRR
jgi:hypothetical protein